MHASPPAGFPAGAVALMAGVVDYAGLFPPAALSMPDALAAYAAAQSSSDAWLLGHFVVPASRIAEMQQHLPLASTPIHLSVILADRSEAEVATLLHLDRSLVVVDAIECKPRDLDGIDWLAGATAPLGADVYVEVDPAAELPRWFDRLAARGLRAKIRTGGTTAAAFPTPAAVIDFMIAAMAAGVTFKATAGLHHAVRGQYRLTYEPAAPEALMYGYLNVLLAAASLRDGRRRGIAEQVLQQVDRSSLVFTDEAIHWGGLQWSAATLRATRTDDLVGFGSCSISEPADEIRALASLSHLRERL